MCRCAAKLVGFLAREAYIIGTRKVRNYLRAVHPTPRVQPSTPNLAHPLSPRPAYVPYVFTAPSPACRAASAPLPNSPPYFTLKLSSPAVAASATESKCTHHKPRSGTAPRNARDVPRTPHTCPCIVGPSSSPSISCRARYPHLGRSRFPGPRPTRTCSRRLRPRSRASRCSQRRTLSCFSTRSSTPARRSSILCSQTSSACPKARAWRPESCSASRCT
jgi:hypothetical protein